MQIIDGLLKDLKMRPYDVSKEHPLVSESYQKIFQSNIEKVESLKQNRYNPLNIVLMGEVKAGKSTLLNAILGEAVSNVGVTETTAVILEISYSTKRKAVVHYFDGRQDEMKIEALNQLLEENREEMDSGFYQSIEKVQLNYPLSKLQDLTIVDTPGLETITATNQKITEDYIKKSDLVIWVMNANHVGQASISNRIVDIVSEGKQLVIGLNRMDQVEAADREKVYDFVEDEYFLYVNEIFQISAQEAFDSIQTNDLEKYTQSGLGELVSYLEDDVESSSEEVKEDVLYDSLAAIIQNEIIIHIAMQEEIKIIDLSIKKREEEREESIQRLNKMIDQKIQHWINHNLLMIEENNILTLAGRESGEIIEKRMREYLSDQYIRQSIEEILKELDDELTEERKRILKDIDNRIIQEAESVRADYKKYSDQYINSGAAVSKKTIQSLSKKNNNLGTYTESFGPTAYVAIGAALSTFLPSILVAGVAGGIAYQYFKKGPTEEVNHEKEIEEIFTSVRKQIKSQMPEIIDRVKKENKNYFKQLDQIVNKNILGEFSLREIKYFEKELIAYQSILEKHLQEVEEIKELHDNSSDENDDLGWSDLIMD